MDIELTSFHLFSLPIHALAHRNVHVSFVRTYNKLKSHHPRDFHAITRASSLRRGQRSCQVSDSPTCPMYPRNDEIMTKDTANHLSISFIRYIYTHTEENKWEMRPEYLLTYEDKWKTWNTICLYIKISGKRGAKFACSRCKVITLRNTLHIYFCISCGPADRCYEENRIRRNKKFGVRREAYHRDFECKLCFLGCKV